MSVPAGIEKPLEAIVSDGKRDHQTDVPLPVTVFNMELLRDKMIPDLLLDSCDDCLPPRRQKADQLAFFGRLSVSQAVLLIEEQYPCKHLDS